MNISSKYNYQAINPQKNLNKKQSFGSLLRYCNREKSRMDSYFFRGTDALQVVIDTLKTTFPQGGKIYDFACSDGEEAITLLAMLGRENLSKYKINCFDMSIDAISLAKKNVYSVFSGLGDDFLLGGEWLSKKSERVKEFFKSFHSIMTPASAPKHTLSNIDRYYYVQSVIENFTEKYFSLRPEYQRLLNFEYGDIRALNNIRPDEKVCAILFRNAFYHLYDNEIMKILFGRNPDNYSGGVKDKQKIIDSLVKKIHSKLEVGGTFTIGDYFSEHAFLANRFVHDKDKEKFKNMPFFNKERFGAFKDLMFMKKSPIAEALECDGKFIPLHKSLITGYPSEKPFEGVTVWQKVK